MTILGRATKEGTQRYRERHKKHCEPTFFHEAGELIASSIGIGTYIGEPDEHTNGVVTKAIVESVRRGVNIIDSSISYRYQQAERSVGEGIRSLIELKEVSRIEVCGDVISAFN